MLDGPNRPGLVRSINTYLKWLKMPQEHASPPLQDWWERADRPRLHWRNEWRERFFFFLQGHPVMSSSVPGELRVCQADGLFFCSLLFFCYLVKRELSLCYKAELGGRWWKVEFNMESKVGYSTSLDTERLYRSTSYTHLAVWTEQSMHLFEVT